MTMTDDYYLLHDLTPAVVAILLHDRRIEDSRDYKFSLLGATLIDLAIRGHIKIKEEYCADDLVPANYILERVEQINKTASLNDYEEKFLGVIFSDSNIFSTKDFLSKMDHRVSFYSRIMKIIINLTDQVHTQYNHVYVTYSTHMRIIKALWVVLLVLFFCLTFLILLFSNLSRELIGIGISAVLLTLVFNLIIAFSRPKRWRVIKNELKQYQTYLGSGSEQLSFFPTLVSEERSMPYALIFSVVDKWEKVAQFSSKIPSWYTPASQNQTVFSYVKFANDFKFIFSNIFASPYGGAFMI